MFSDSRFSLRELARVIGNIITGLPVVKAKVSALFALGLCGNTTTFSYVNNTGGIGSETCNSLE